ncbi:MAG: PD-(D/E)XK nuclease family protein [Archangium sp.]|nr:PD-(D/E)XK nuclease family protein [Archangium sp.]MDP3574296.1 PD-(D/E)XK nuclease family protein [Archangium sp.]
MSRRLVVVPDSDRVEQWLLDQSRQADFVDLRGVCTLSELVERCDPAGDSRRGPANPLLVRMAFGKLAAQHAVSAYGVVAHSAEFAAQAQELINHLRGQAVTARQLELAAGQVEGSLAVRAKALAALWRAVDGFLEERRLVDRADWWRLAAERVAADGLPVALQRFESIEVEHVHDVPPSRLALLEALAKACNAAGVRFVWRWPASGHAATDAFIINTVREVEAKWQALEVELEADVPDGPLAWIGQEIFSEDVRPREAPELSAFCAPSTRDEAREIARRVRRLITAGVPPEAIGIAYRDLAADTELLVEALADLGVPARARLGVPLAQSPHGRLALAVLQLPEDGFPAEDVASLLESRSITVLDKEASEPRRTFREAGVRDDVVGGEQRETHQQRAMPPSPREGEGSPKGAYAVRLASLAQRSREAGRRVNLLAQAVDKVIGWCNSVPEQGTALELLEAWWDVVTRLGLLEPARRGEVPPLAGSMSAEVDRALARDQAAVEALMSLLTELKEALKDSGLARQFMARRDFARWVRLSAAEKNLVARGARASAVWLIDAREVAGRQFAQLFLGGLLDGRFPGRPTPLALLSEEERGTLNRIAQRALFRTTVGEGDVRLPTRLAEDRLLLHLALSSAASVTVSRARYDDGGRELLASPFRAALARCVEGFREEPVHRAAVARLDEVQSEAELRVRAALEALGPAITRQTEPDVRRGALGEALAAEAWFQDAKAKSQIEAERLRYFTDPEQRSGPFTGQVDGEVLEALQARLAFDAVHPVSSFELGKWGTCSFQGLATVVLDLEGGEQAGEELDSRTRGSFWHEALARLVPELTEAGLLGKDDPSVRRRVEEAVKAGARDIARTKPTGHPALWALAQEWAVTVLHRIVTGPEAQPFGLARPKYIETWFGDRRAPEALREVTLPAALPGELDVYFTGKMDRVDLVEGTVGVLDYKTSVKRTLGQDFLRSEFQMALYLLAVKALMPEAVPSGAWLGLGKGELKSVTSVLDRSSNVKELLATDEFTRVRLEKEGKHNLANSVHDLLGRLRTGDFGARPVDCAYCELKPVCRISQRQLAEEP